MFISYVYNKKCFYWYIRIKKICNDLATDLNLIKTR